MTRLGGLKGPSDCVGIVKGDPIYYRGPTKKKYLGPGLYTRCHGRPNDYRGPTKKNKSWVQDCTRGVMVDLMYYRGPTKKNKSWVQDCTRGAMDLMYHHGPTKGNKSWVQDCT